MRGFPRTLDAVANEIHSWLMKAGKQAAPAEEKTSGTKMVEKYRSRMSRLSPAKREKLLAQGMQMIYGEHGAKSTHRR
jgi:hypothetical protein